MIANERYESILNSIKSGKNVKTSELTERFGVSIETIRRDLAYLESEGLLKRVHGGAVAMSSYSRIFERLDERTAHDSDKKREISERAAELINEGDIIASDAGSTANIFAKVLTERFERLTIVCYSLDMIELLREKSSFKLIIPGGSYIPSERIFFDWFTVAALRDIHVGKSFIFPSAVSKRFGITCSMSECYALQSTLCGICDMSIALADSTKFEVAAPIKVCGADEVDLIITDSGLDDELLASYRRKNISITRCEKSEESK